MTNAHIVHIFQSFYDLSKNVFCPLLVVTFQVSGLVEGHSLDILHDEVYAFGLVNHGK